MRKIAVCLFVLFFAVCPVFAMSVPAADNENSQPLIKNPKASAIKSAVEQICDGNFAEAEKIAQKIDGNSPASSKILDIVSQYDKLQQSIKQTRKQAYKEQLSKLEQFKSQTGTNEPNVPNVFQIIANWAENHWLCTEGEPNLPEIPPIIAGSVDSEPNLLEIFPVIFKAREAADADHKDSVLTQFYVKETIAKSKKAAEDFESKGDFIDALLYCYSWLAALDENNKEYTDKKEQLEEKAIIQASLQDSPCESTLDRYEKITPEMFIRAIDMLEYGYVEPFRYGTMVEKVFKRCNCLAEVLSISQPSDKSIKFEFKKDGIPQFVIGMAALNKEYNAESSITMSKDQFVKFFKSVLTLNSTTMELPQQILIWHFADASLNALDPHTTLIWPKQVEDFEKNMTNEFTGIGVEISKEDGLLKAVSLVPGAPAYSSGIDAGDIIESVNGESTKEMSITCAVSKITGPAGTKVKLLIRRPDEEKGREIEITRAKIVVPTTRGWSRDNSGNWLYFVDDKDKIGYVRVTQFSASTAADLDNVLTQLEAQGLKALVLDLRYNTGGYLQSAADITDLFVEKGVMVSTQPRIGLPTWETAEKKGTHPNYPLVILINSGSASASEIVAGALSDKVFSRATLVGQQSYGKGSVQTISEYPGNNAQLKYTMAYYHLPSGQRVNDCWAMKNQNRTDWGVMPSVKIELIGEEIKKILEIERDNDVLAAADHDTSKSKLKRHDLQETLQADYQLETAILVAKAKLIEAGLAQ